MKNRIKLSVFSLFISIIIVFIILIYLLYNTLQLESNKFEYSTSYLSFSEFYKYKIDKDKLYLYCNTLLKKLNKEEDKNININTYKKELIDTLKKTFKAYEGINKDLKGVFTKNDINVSYTTLISLSKFSVFDTIEKFTITNSKDSIGSVIYLFGDSSIITNNAADSYLFFSDRNYSFQIDLHIKYKSLWEYYIKKNKNVIFGALIIFLVFIVLVIYTIKTILNQEEHIKIKNDFINNITHEIQTPITTISIASRTLLNPAILSQKTEVSELAKSIETQSRRLITLVDNVLNLSVLRKKDVQLQYERIDLHEIINRVIQSFNIRKHVKPLHINTNYNTSNSIISADPFYIEMILTNLIDNAIKYSKDNIDINISTTESNKCYLISISDKGIGISKAHQKHLFKQFYRVPTGNIHNIKGTGLGLYYVYLITKSHGGKISVDSELNVGTTFLIKLKKHKKNNRLNYFS